MIAHYGFKDGSGDWYVTIDTGKCNGCGKCAEVCPAHALEVGEDELDPFSEEQVARVKDEERKKLRYTCAPCQPGYGKHPPPCITACEPGAISHTEAWQQAYAKS